jgi:hypothetical protein
MTLLKSGIGVIAVLVGLLWIGQGLNILGGSVMSGHRTYAVLGFVVGVAGLWLLWSSLRSRRQAS